MSSYEALAGTYDALTGDVGYEKRADYLEKLFKKSRIPVHTVLDLACGTGTMTWILTGRGYELIGVDGSEEMLAAAMSKSGCVEGIAPVFLHQSMPKLDLYGTVDAAICCLDSLNYLTNPKDVQRTFDRLRLFIAPGGVLIFDITVSGYNKDGIRALIGITQDGTVENLGMVSISETAGLGTKINDKAFLSGYIGAADAAEGPDAITGAT